MSVFIASTCSVTCILAISAEIAVPALAPIAKATNPGAITVPMVVIIAEFVGILGGMLVSLAAIDLHPARYINSVWLWLFTKDIYVSILKAFVFGILITLVCATQGYETKGGAKEVGVSTTLAAIKSTVYMLMADFLINLVFYL